MAINKNLPKKGKLTSNFWSLKMFCVVLCKSPKAKKIELQSTAEVGKARIWFNNTRKPLEFSY